MSSPVLWIIGGVNGAGKSTLVKQHLEGKIAVVNPDNIARDQEVSNRSAGALALELRRNHLAARHSFAVETTLTGMGEIRLMQQAASAGYEVNFVYVGLSCVELSAARVYQRVVSGGHDVPVADIFRRYQRSLTNLPNAMAAATRIWIFDNSCKRRRLLLTCRRGSAGFTAGHLPTWLLTAAGKELESSLSNKAESSLP